MSEANSALHSLVLWAGPALIRTLIGAALIVGLAGTARSVGYMVGLAPNSRLRMRRSRVVVDLIVAAGLVLVARRFLTTGGSVDLGELSGVNLVVSPPWSALVPVGLALLWLRAVSRSYGQARQQPAVGSGDQILIVRSAFNPDEVFTPQAYGNRRGRTVDQWLLSEGLGLWALLLQVFAFQMAEMLTARNDVLSQVIQSHGKAAGPAGNRDSWHESHGYGAYDASRTPDDEVDRDRTGRGFPVGAVSIGWAWALWRLPVLLGYPFANRSTILTIGGFLPSSTPRTTLIEHLDWIPTPGPALGPLDAAVWLAVVLVLLRRRGSILVNIVLFAVALGSLAGVLAMSLTETVLPIWQTITVLPLVAVIIRLCHAEGYYAPPGWWQSGPARSSGSPPIAISIAVGAVLAAVLTAIASFLAQYSFAMASTGNAEPSGRAFDVALHVLGPYAALTFGYVILVEIIFQLTTNLTISPMNNATIWALGTLLFGGILVLSVLAPHLVDAGNGTRLQYINDPRPAKDSYPTPEAWMCGPIMFVMVYTWATTALLLKPLDRFRVHVPQAVRLG